MEIYYSGIQSFRSIQYYIIYTHMQKNHFIAQISFCVGQAKSENPLKTLLQLTHS